jgi:hypothetical protein
MRLSKRSKNTLFGIACFVSFFAVFYVSGFLKINMDTYGIRKFCIYTVYDIIPSLICEGLSYYIFIFIMFFLPLRYFYKKRNILIFTYITVLCVAMVFWGFFFLWLSASL